VKASSFWPPGRTRARVAAEIYRRRHLDEPWLTRDAIGLLSELLTGSDRVLEWGAGTSTAWLGGRVDTLISVEHDPGWFERVRSELEHAGLDPGAVRLLSLSPPGEPAHSPYVRAIDEFADGELSVCVIDGEHRAACALEAVPKLGAGGLLIIDDIHHHLDHRTSSPHSRYGRGPLDGDWERVQRGLAGWRLIWTSDGFSDTGFWIKP